MLPASSVISAPACTGIHPPTGPTTGPLCVRASVESTSVLVPVPIIYVIVHADSVTRPAPRHPPFPRPFPGAKPVPRRISHMGVSVRGRGHRGCCPIARAPTPQPHSTRTGYQARPTTPRISAKRSYNRPSRAPGAHYAVRRMHPAHSLPRAHRACYNLWHYEFRWNSGLSFYDCLLCKTATRCVPERQRRRGTCEVAWREGEILRPGAGVYWWTKICLSVV